MGIGRRRARRRWSHRLVIAFNLVVVLVCVSTALGLLYLRGKDRIARLPVAGLVPDGGDAESPVTFPNGDKVTTQNWLITGSDNRSCIDRNSPDAEGFFGAGDAGERSDTIMVLRIDPDRHRAAILSFPRDLWVTIGDGKRQGRINSAFKGKPPDELVTTITKNFHIELNHWLNIDFCAFRNLVDAVGGVSIRFDTPVRDVHTGLDIADAGCHRMDGLEALKFARSRYYQTLVPDSTGKLVWTEDPRYDLDRIRRQQQLIKILVQRAIDSGARSPRTFDHLFNAVGDNITTDDSRTNGDLIQLARRMVSIDPATVQTYLFESISDRIDGNDIQRIPTNGPMKTRNDQLLALFGSRATAGGAASTGASVPATGEAVGPTSTPAASNSLAVPTLDQRC